MYPFQPDLQDWHARVGQLLSTDVEFFWFLNSVRKTVQNETDSRDSHTLVLGKQNSLAQEDPLCFLFLGNMCARIFIIPIFPQTHH